MDLTEGVDAYEAKSTTYRWVTALNEANCTELELSGDYPEMPVKYKAATLYVWQRVFLHPKSNLKRISFGKDDFTITREGNGKNLEFVVPESL